MTTGRGSGKNINSQGQRDLGARSRRPALNSKTPIIEHHLFHILPRVGITEPLLVWLIQWVYNGSCLEFLSQLERLDSF